MKKKTKPRVTVAKEYLDNLKGQLKYVEKELDKVKEDRRKFREEFVKLLRDNVSAISQNQYYSAEVMINRLSKLMNRVEYWYWS